MWIGGRKGNGYWYWRKKDGSMQPIEIGYWAKGQPDDDEDKECMITYGSDVGLICDSVNEAYRFANKECSEKFEFICETEKESSEE